MRMFSATGLVAACLCLAGPLRSQTAPAPLDAEPGAFPLERGSRDAALVARLSRGAYTVRVSGTGLVSRVALPELYELP